MTSAIDVFFDGDCPLCKREIAMLKKRDKKGLITPIDIAVPSFDPSVYGKSLEEFMAKIQGRLPSGEFITGVEVFRHLYSAVGLGWLVPVTRIPGISHLLDALYAWFARNRLRLTGRCEGDVCQSKKRQDDE